MMQPTWRYREATKWMKIKVNVEVQVGNEASGEKGGGWKLEGKLEGRVDFDITDLNKKEPTDTIGGGVRSHVRSYGASRCYNYALVWGLL